MGDRSHSAESDGLSGVPLGGIGAGCIEMGADGRFRNITINNNRTASERIPVSQGGFLAVRTAQRGRVATRILQTDSGLPFEEAGIVPPLVPGERLTWRGLYPCAHYKLDDRQFPLDVSWNATSPIIPYDIDASTLPLISFNVYVNNPTDKTSDVAVLFNWENLCGCTRHHWPNKRGPILPVVVKQGQELALETGDAPEGEAESGFKPVLAGLEFGFRGDYRTNAEGNYCLVAKQQQDVSVSMMAWNERNPRELTVLWDDFRDKGCLRDALSRSPESHSGALCCTFTLEPHKGRSVVFLLAWCCPRYEIDGLDLGNGYMNRYPHSLHVVNRALQHYRYFFKSVEDWQNRLLSSSLPKWFSKALLNSNHVLSTNTQFTAGGHFSVMETPEDGLMGGLDRRLHSSLGPLLFFPEFEGFEVMQFANAASPAGSERLPRYLGKESPHAPQNGPSAPLSLDGDIKFVLMICRNYHMTGKLFILEQLYPRMKKVMAALLAEDRDGDGLPEQDGAFSAYEDWPVTGVGSYTCGLWLAALRAYSAASRKLGHENEAREYEKVFAKALKRFQELLWDDEKGYYRHSATPVRKKKGGDAASAPRQEICHVGQLAGQWYAEFLHLGHLLPEPSVQRALGAICRLNEKRYGVAKGVSLDGAVLKPEEGMPDAGDAWPPFYLAEYCSLLMSHGFTDRALYVFQKHCKNTFARRGRTFSQPLGWDLEANDARGRGSDRYMGASAAWHLYYALQGLFLDMADRTLWLRPNLPLGVHFLSAPIFTPVCLGWLRFREDDSERYRQRVVLSFDSPVVINTFVLRIPEEVQDIHVNLIAPDGETATEHVVGTDGPDHLVEIIPQDPVTIRDTLTLTIHQTKGREVVLDETEKEMTP